MTDNDSYTRGSVPQGQLVMTGPGETAEPGHLPVRGDLAHIRLAGRYFVPHYAVPMPHAVKDGGAILRASGSDDATELCQVESGAVFNVLDIAGKWAWGQVGEHGFVGYLTLDTIEVVQG